MLNRADALMMQVSLRLIQPYFAHGRTQEFKIEIKQNGSKRIVNKKQLQSAEKAVAEFQKKPGDKAMEIAAVADNIVIYLYTGQNVATARQKIERNQSQWPYYFHKNGDWNLKRLVEGVAQIITPTAHEKNLQYGAFVVL